ncbi:MAG: peptide deformylase [Gammaproteobacteria bacterium]|nr:peptide deformylase [Gammaproteobacteria bacterium]MCP5136708.1 peptide deformylase [Gammaproteobacteria bacterium]
MAILDILQFPDNRLRTKAQPVAEFNAELGKLIDDMFETMYRAPGIGLAATQIDVHRQLIVIDISEEKNEPRVFINPEIVRKDGIEEMEEGCLSVPGAYEKVRRADRITVRALDRDGKPFELEADGLLAVCVQHEIDHLNGKLFVDHISELKRQRIRSKLVKVQKQHKKPDDDRHTAAI